MLARSRTTAFTLLELLVAVAITIVIVVALGTMFTSIGATASHANQRTDAFRDARAALQMMTRDFANLVRTQWDPDPFSNPPPTTQPQPRTRALAYLALDNIADNTAYNQELFGLVALKNAGLGDLCSVGYYCSWDGTAYSLRRFFRNSAQTYNTIFGQPGYVDERTLYTPVATGSTPDDILAQYVWNLHVTAYDSAGGALAYPYICDTSAALAIKPPVAVEISFNAISPQAARTVMSVTSDPNEWDPAKANVQNSIYRRLILPNTYHFRARVEL